VAGVAAFGVSVLLGLVDVSFLVGREFLVMAWAIAYSATVIAIAYAIPRALAIWAQLQLMRAQIESLNETSMSSTGEIDWSTVKFDVEGGGYV